MCPQAAAQEDLAVGLTPCAPPVVSAEVSGPLTLSVSFQDGLHGTVRFEETHLDGVFHALRDPRFFAQVSVQAGAVTWPGELDLAPDAMYDAIKQNGRWLLQ